MPLASLSDALTSVVGDHGVYAVFALMAIDAVLPAASELIMVYGGALAAGVFAGQNVVVAGEEVESSAGRFLAIALAGTLGYLVGAVGGWAIGVYGGRPLLERRGRWLHLSPARLERAERWFERFGEWAVFLGRITPVARSFVSIPAGVFRQPLGRYTALTLLGSALWCFPLTGIGWTLGSNWERFHHAFRYADYAIAAAVVALAVFLVLRHRSSRIARRAQDPAR